MKYAFFVHAIRQHGEPLLLASIAAEETHYDGLGYLQPEPLSQVLEIAAAHLARFRAPDMFTGITLLHPATDRLNIREERWEFESSACPLRPLTTRHQLADGRTLQRASFRLLPSLTVEL